MTKREVDFGKHRTYICPECRRICLRQLKIKPFPCKCGRNLCEDRYAIDDVIVSARNSDFQYVKFG